MNNKQPRIEFVFNRRKKASLLVKASVEMRATHNYKQKYIATGIMLYANQWRKGRIVNCPEVLQISNTLDTLLSTKNRQALFEMIEI